MGLRRMEAKRSRKLLYRTLYRTSWKFRSCKSTTYKVDGIWDVAW